MQYNMRICPRSASMARLVRYVKHGTDRRYHIMYLLGMKPARKCTREGYCSLPNKYGYYWHWDEDGHIHSYKKWQ